MPTPKYGFDGSVSGLNAPAGWGENWGSNTLNPAFNNQHVSGQGINPYGANLYGQTNVLDSFKGYQPTDALDSVTKPQGMFGGMFDNFLSKKNLDGTATEGWGSPVLGVANGLMSGYMGMKNYGLSKDIFENNKSQFERNFGAQAKLTNASLSDRQERRVADAKLNNQQGVTSVADYMSKYGVA